MGNNDWHESAASHTGIIISGMVASSTPQQPVFPSSIFLMCSSTAMMFHPVPVMDVLFEGPVTLTPGETYTTTAYNSTGVPTTYTVNRTTPLGVS